MKKIKKIKKILILLNQGRKETKTMKIILKKMNLMKIYELSDLDQD